MRCRSGGSGRRDQNLVERAIWWSKYVHYAKVVHIPPRRGFQHAPTTRFRTLTASIVSGTENSVTNIPLILCETGLLHRTKCCLVHIFFVKIYQGNCPRKLLWKPKKGTMADGKNALTVAFGLAIPPSPGARHPPGRGWPLLFSLLLCRRLGGGSPAPVVSPCRGGTRRGRVAAGIIGSGSIAAGAARPLEPHGAAVQARGIRAQCRQVREGRHG